MTKVTKRKSQSGIVLISTLLSLSLLTMFALTIQAKSIASAKTYRKLIQATEVDASRAAVRELARPLVLEAMIDFERETQLRLNSTPFELEWQGRSLTVVAQDVEGMLNIYRPWPEKLMALVPEDVRVLVRYLSKNNPAPSDPLLRQITEASDIHSLSAQNSAGLISNQGEGNNLSTIPFFLNAPKASAFRQPRKSEVLIK